MWNPSYLQINVQISINKKRYFYVLKKKVVMNPCKTMILGGRVSLVELPFWKALTQLYPFMPVWPNLIKRVGDAICHKNYVLNMQKCMWIKYCWIEYYGSYRHISLVDHESPNWWILFFACFTNSSRSSLWNSSKSLKRLLESILIFTLQILGNSTWYLFWESTQKLYLCSLTVTLHLM